MSNENVGMYERYLNSRHRSFRAESKTQVRLPDPFDVETPMKITLVGLCGNSDEQIAELVLAQQEVKINSKKNNKPTETGLVKIDKRVWHKGELAEMIIMREKLLEAIKNNTVEEFLREEEEYTEKVLAGLATLQEHSGLTADQILERAHILGMKTGDILDEVAATAAAKKAEEEAAAAAAAAAKPDKTAAPTAKPDKTGKNRVKDLVDPVGSNGQK